MTTALLRAIQERDTDAPRLAYARWLGRRGDADRAEFIRLQLAAHRGEATPQSRARTRALQKANRARWLGDLSRVISGERYERGFLVACKARPVADRALRESPIWATVQRLETSDPGLAASPALWSLRELHGLSTHGFARLCASRTRTTVESVVCADPKQVPEDERSLPRPISRADGVPRLRALAWKRPQNGFHGPGAFPPAELRWILNGPLGRRLERLTIRYYEHDFDTGLDMPEYLEEPAQPVIADFLRELAPIARVPRLELAGENCRFVLARVAGTWTLRLVLDDQDLFNPHIVFTALAGLPRRAVPCVEVVARRLWPETIEKLDECFAAMPGLPTVEYAG